MQRTNRFLSMLRRLRSASGSLAAALVVLVSCGGPTEPDTAASNPRLAGRGSVEVTARLVEIPEGAIFHRDLYDYVTILKYEVIKVHRGTIESPILFVGHYNPWKPRSEAADRRVPDIGGNLRRFEAGQVHRMALDVPIENFYMGGIVNKYFGQETGPLYWAVWTNQGR